MTRINDYERILKGAYVDIISKELKNTKKYGKSITIRCRDCGRSGVTLRKCSDGQYICEECMRKGGLK